MSQGVIWRNISPEQANLFSQARDIVKIKPESEISCLITLPKSVVSQNS